MKHTFYTSTDCPNKDQWCDCWICKQVTEGGLAICKVCNCSEGTLTTDCCGEKVPMKKQDEIYAGKIDYINGEWVAIKAPFAKGETS